MVSAMTAGDESSKYNIFASVNAVTPDRRSRTRDAIGAVRHVSLTDWSRPVS
jgi:hypothetical protein